MCFIRKGTYFVKNEKSFARKPNTPQGTASRGLMDVTTRQGLCKELLKTIRGNRLRWTAASRVASWTWSNRGSSSRELNMRVKIHQITLWSIKGPHEGDQIVNHLEACSEAASESTSTSQKREGKENLMSWSNIWASIWIGPPWGHYSKNLFSFSFFSELRQKHLEK